MPARNSTQDHNYEYDNLAQSHPDDINGHLYRVSNRDVAATG